MRSGGRRPGTGTLFLDSATGERLLEVVASEQGETFIAFTLYDCEGNLVADSGGLQVFIEGREVRDQNDELLLLIPPREGGVDQGTILYRLYSQKGALLTCSDGARTQLFGGIKLEAVKPPVRSHFASTSARGLKAPEAVLENGAQTSEAETSVEHERNIQLGNS